MGEDGQRQNGVHAELRGLLVGRASACRLVFLMRGESAEVFAIEKPAT